MSELFTERERRDEREGERQGDGDGGREWKRKEERYKLRAYKVEESGGGMKTCEYKERVEESYSEIQSKIYKAGKITRTLMKRTYYHILRQSIDWILTMIDPLLH